MVSLMDEKQASLAMPAGLPTTEAASMWVGNQAAIAGKVDEFLELVHGDILRAAFATGAASYISARGKIPRPSEVCDTDNRRFRRMISIKDGSNDKPFVLPISISRLVRHPAAGRASFDITITGKGKTATMWRMDGASIGNYKAIRDLAIENCIALPYQTTKAKAAWDKLLSMAFESVVNEKPEVEENHMYAIREEIRTILLDAEVGESDTDLRRGLVFQDTITADISIFPKILVSRVRARLHDDKPLREEIAGAARMLGMQTHRPQMENGNRPRLWKFPIEKLARKTDD